MKREAWDHPKFKLLARDLKLPMCFVRGIMTSVWLAATINFPAGDIGRWSNEEIAVSIDYPGDADELVSALIKRKLLDVIADEAGRLYIHDWHEHCDRYVNLRILKTKSLYANGMGPRRKEQDSAEETDAKPGMKGNADERTRKDTKERETPSTSGLASQVVVSPIPSPGTSPSPSPGTSPGVVGGEPLVGDGPPIDPAEFLSLEGVWAPLGLRLDNNEIRRWLRQIERFRQEDSKLRPVTAVDADKLREVLDTNRVSDEAFIEVLKVGAVRQWKSVNPQAVIRVFREQLGEEGGGGNSGGNSERVRTPEEQAEMVRLCHEEANSR